MARVAVIGTTGWGTTLAALFGRNGNDVFLMARTAAEADAINAARENVRHRPGLRLPPNVSATIDPEALAASDLVVLAVPSATLRSNLVRYAPAIAADASVLSAAKGIEPDTCLRMSEIMAAFGIEEERVLVLSGPNFASEIASGLPAATVIAGRQRQRAEAAQKLLAGPTLRVYTSDDVVGVEIGGALKNVIAIACGLSDGLGYGENARAALITRGLAEITRLGVAAGAQPLTFLGLAGLGDLVLSCGSNLSRNRRLGLALARDASLSEALASIDGVVEGVVTARAVPVLASRLAVEMPICASLHAVLFEGKSSIEAGRELMARAARQERD
ncbi:MAG TPA: NAD(P)H-dependent glycerol-3-phosphate dehydrogenase [Dehalococcoidia bacterium]|nr:NAD(P)H-dependent glycerol-3-phosphate dehydrogenase [Dehalococcoidia bacterium]